MAVEVAASGGTLNRKHVVEITCWYLPEAMLRHEGDAEPQNVRILRARGDSMEPTIHDGDRLLVDMGRKTLGTGKTAVLRDGGGLVMKRVEIASWTTLIQFRLCSANLTYLPYTCLAEETSMMGAVTWLFRKV